MPIIVPEGEDKTSAIRRVRLLLNDVAAEAADRVFSDGDIEDFLSLEDWNVKRAAAQAIDTNADNEALASKVLRTQDVQTDGAKVAQALHQRADSLREQADREDENGDGFYFGVVSLDDTACRPERTQYPVI